MPGNWTPRKLSQEKELNNDSTLKHDGDPATASQTDFDSMSFVQAQGRAHEGKRRREYKVLSSHLRNVHERISHALHEGGYSTELPEACLEDAKGLTYRPPDFCVESDDADTDEQKIAKAAFDAFIDCAQTRHGLVKSVYDWMNATSLELDSHTLKMFERGLLSREGNTVRSQDEFSDAMMHTLDVISKLKEIGRAIFEERNDDIRNYSSNQGSKRNADKLSLISDKYQPQLANTLICDTKGLVKEINELCDISDGEIQTLLGEISSEWKHICRDIWDHLLALHDLKMLKKPTKMKISKILYLFKMLAMHLQDKDDKIEEMEKQLLNAKTELIHVKAKLDHSTSQFKKLRERCTKAQGLVAKISQEREKIRAESDELKIELTSCIHKIADLNSLVEKLQSQRQSLLATNAANEMMMPVRDDSDDNRREEKARFLTQLMKDSEERIEKMQARIDDITKERDELKESLDKKDEASKEAHSLLEENLKSAEQRLEGANRVIKELRSKLSMVENDTTDQSMLINHLKMELGVKKETIRKLSTLAQETSFSDSEDSAHHLNPSVKHQNSQVNSSAAGSQLSVSGFDSKLKDTKLKSNESEKEAKSSQTSGTVVLGLKGKDVIPDLEELEKMMESPNFQVDNKEYVRVVKGWNECDKLCQELDSSIEALENKLVKTYKKQKRRVTLFSKELQVQQVLQEDQHKDELISLCSEALNLDSTIHWYKTELSALAESASLNKIATDINSLYTHRAVVNTESPKEGIKAFNTRVEDALKKLLKNQHSMVKSMQEGQRKVKLDAEKTVGMEIAHHIKVLAEKSGEVQRYKNVAELLQKELRNLKMDHQRIARLNEVNKYRLEATMNDRRRSEDLSKKIVNTADILVPKDNQHRELKRKLSFSRNDYKKLSNEYDSLQEALARETELRITVEKAAEKFIHKIKDDKNNPSIIKGGRDSISRGKKVGLSKSMKRAKILEKLLELKPTLELSHIGQQLIKDIEESVSSFRDEVEKKWITFVRRYIFFKRFNNYRSELRKKIMWQRASGESAENLGDLQNDFWQIEEKLEQPRKVSWKKLVTKTLLPAKRRLDFVFLKVVECLSVLNKNQNFQGQNEVENAQTQSTVAPRPSSASSCAQPLAMQYSYNSGQSVIQQSTDKTTEDNGSEKNISTAKVEKKESLSIVIDENPQQTMLKRKASGDVAPTRVMTKTSHVARMGNLSFASIPPNSPNTTFLNNNWIVTESRLADGQVPQEIPRMLHLDVQRSINNATKRLQDSIKKYTAGRSTGGSRPTTVAKELQECFHTQEGMPFTKKVDILSHKPAPKFWNQPTEWEDTSQYRPTLKPSRSLGELQVQAIQLSYRFRPMLRKNVKDDASSKTDELIVTYEAPAQSQLSFGSLDSYTQAQTSNTVDRDTSDDLSSGAYKVEAIRRRSSDVVTLPSISGSTDTNKMT